MNKRSQLIIIIVISCVIVFGVGVLLMDRNGYINIIADTADITNVSASINNNFTVNKDQLAVIDSEKLVAYISEIKDNRCHLDVICFYPGTVEIKLSLVKNGRALGILEFSSYTDLEYKDDMLSSTKSKNLGNYKIFLTGVGEQARDNNVSNLTATFYISKFSQGSAKSMIFKAGLPSMNGKVLTTYKDSNIYIDEFEVKANSINGSEPYQYITTSQSEKLYFKPKKYLSQKKEYSFKNTDSITFEFSNLLIGDLNEDDTINSLDWSLMNKYWQQNNQTYDLTGDSTINSLDWSLMNANWGKQGDGLKDGWEFL